MPRAEGIPAVGRPGCGHAPERTKAVRRYGKGRDGRYAHHKLQAFAELSGNKRDVGVPDGYTW